MNAFSRLLIGALALLTACDAGSSRGEGEPVAQARGPRLGAQLEDRSFILVSVSGPELVEGTEIRITFGDGAVSAHAGCNHMSGPFTIEGNVLRVTRLGSTAIGCDAERHAQDEWLQNLLTSSPSLTFDDPELTLETSDTTLRLIDREIGSPDRPLVGTDWLGTASGDSQVLSGGAGNELVSLHFDDEGTIEVFTSCQSGSGTFTVTGSTIELHDVAYNDEPCANSDLETLAAQVQFVLSDGRVTFEIEEANLTLERDDKVLLFRADE